MMKKFLWILVIALSAQAAEHAGAQGTNKMRAMTTGIGSGTITSSPAGINCGGTSGTSCVTTFPEGSTVTLTATPSAPSTFAGWEGDCSGTGTVCTLVMKAHSAVRAAFDVARPDLADLSPASIEGYLKNNPTIDTAAKFLAALPTMQKFKENWILMSRSESLQTGTATSPRILLPSEDSAQVFSVTLEAHKSFPAATQNTIEYMQWDGTAKRFRFHEINLTTRTVWIDDPKCQKCHSGRPNWDAYDSWGGMLPFNRDRVYKGSVEAAALRKLFNLWDQSDAIRPVLEQLTLPKEMERINGGSFDGSVTFPFDDPPKTRVLKEPAIDSKLPTVPAFYFVPLPLEPPSPITFVHQGGDFFRLSNSFATVTDEGRGVDLFDHLTEFNAQRIARELIDHQTPVDVRPIALAIAEGCVNEADIGIDGKFVTATQRKFFEHRNGMNLDGVFHDTLERRHSVPRRKADIQRLNLMGSDGPDAFVTENAGLIGAYGSLTTSVTDKTVPRIRQEVFRRPLEGFPPDIPITGFMIDREVYEERLDPGTNTKIALFRYFLEPLGVAVDKWSMSVRGRSRTYTFADLFPIYLAHVQTALNACLKSPGCPKLIDNSQKQFEKLPSAYATPAYADVQKIFNRNCTECHGGLGYPPYGPGPLDLSEGKSYDNAKSRAESGILLNRITRLETDPLVMPYGGPKLSGTDIETIKRWIAGGAKE